MKSAVTTSAVLVFLAGAAAFAQTAGQPPQPQAAAVPATDAAIKLLAGVGEPLCGRLLSLDTLTGSASTLSLLKNPDCPACGAAPRIRLPLRPSDYEIERSCAV